MGIDVAETFEDGFDRLATPSGGLLVVVLALYGSLRSLVYETAVGSFIEFGINEFGADVAQEMGYQVSDADVSVRRLQQELIERQEYALAEFVEQATSTGLDLSLPVVLVFLATLPFVAEFLHVVGVRALADDPESLPDGDLLDGIGGTYAKSLASNFVAWVLIGIGLLLAVIPGILLALVFLFVRQRVVLAGDGVFAALCESYGTFKRNVGALVVVFLVLLLLGMFSTVGLGMLGVPGWLYPILVAAIVAFELAVITSAYLQTEAATAA
ncbi:hypothetical protein G9C85_18505 [Halorubellus sp. JP-L1]|uniref:hypothetical protein n=1 Tax=Halorubellus sp. JP-L1 TaxID=2715753 RepID=UPI00140E0912|nr:hypothetical protein [Halorubellus sp. JP-L1]NHN43615.1 hypothetical protein [Halorubellus sp. JP-L1]